MSKQGKVVTFINTVEDKGIGTITTRVIPRTRVPKDILLSASMKDKGYQVAPTLGELINKNKNN